MKIKDIRFERYTGTLTSTMPLFAERLIRPLDVYPEHRSEPAGGVAAGRLQADKEGRRPISCTYASIDTDEGLTGLAGPINEHDAYFIEARLREFLIGEDALATERIWDKMYRYLIHGRKGDPMMAVSIIDCALWDLRGKAAGLPVYRLLGGPVRTSFPAYASMLGFPIDPESATRQARAIASQGYRGMKWFARNGPADGEQGARRNVELMRALRDAVGDEVDIMLDAWNSWDVRYALDMARRLAEYRPRWLEEVVKPDDIAGYARVRATSPVPISGGEHEYTRWGAREYLTAGAVDVFQPDTFWAGGISEMVKICAMASAFEVQVVPHGYSVPVNAHLTAALSPTVTPYIEYLLQWQELNQFFEKHPVKPVNGMVTVNDLPGLGLAIDEEKVEERRTLTWR